MKVLTISIASYNAAETLEKCIDSMVNSRYINNLEILIVNDGSTDDTLLIASSYEKMYPDSVIVIDKPNGGHGSTINSAISAATGEYFKIVDADDWVDTANMDKMIESFAVEPDLILNPFYEVNAKTDTKTIRRVFPDNYENNRIYNMNACIADIVFAMHAMTIKTSILREMNQKIDEHCFYVDLEYVLFPIPYISTVLFLNFPVYNYLRGTPNQSVNLEVFLKRRNQHEKVLKRLYDFYGELPDKNCAYANAIKNRIVIATYIQYRVLYMLPPSESEKEYINFDQIVPQEIFTCIRGNTGKLATFLRKSQYKMYYIAIFVLQLLKVIKKDENIL